jgi:Capsule polysaccharide biosynthesis protein
MKKIEEIFNKTILVQTTYQPTPHLETELEIIEKLLNQENAIYWIICQGDFKVCFHNPNHNVGECKRCYTRVSNGFHFLKTKVINHQNLHILKYNQFLKTSEFEKQFDFESDLLSFKDLKIHKYKTYDSGLATASSLVSLTRDHLPNIHEFKKFVSEGLFTGAYLYESFQLIIDKINPNLVLLFNGRFIENRPLLRVCQERKIDFVTHERGGKLNNYLFRINSTPHSLDTISKEIESLWENAEDDKVEIGKMFYINRIKRVEDAWYSFTKEQQEGRLPESFKQNLNKKIVTIFNSSLDEYEGLEGFGPYFYEDDNTGISAICESLQNHGEIKLYLRIHPNLKGLENSQNKDLKLIQSRFKNIEIIAAEDSVDTYELINKSEIIIVFGSTVGIEAAFASKNVILLGHAAYQNLKCFVKPKNHIELVNILTNLEYNFPVINIEDVLKYGYWNETFGVSYKNYIPTNLTEGVYKGKKVELTWWQIKKINFFISLNRKKRKYLGM